MYTEFQTHVTRVLYTEKVVRALFSFPSLFFFIFLVLNFASVSVNFLQISCFAALNRSHVLCFKFKQMQTETFIQFPLIMWQRRGQKRDGNSQKSKRKQAILTLNHWAGMLNINRPSFFFQSAYCVCTMGHSNAKQQKEPNVNTSAIFRLIDLIRNVYVFAIQTVDRAVCVVYIFICHPKANHLK